MIEVGDAHWQWHVDQLVRVLEDHVQAVVETGDVPDQWELDQLLERRREGFVGTDQFGGSPEAWDAAVRAARARSKVTVLRRRT